MSWTGRQVPSQRHQQRQVLPIRGPERVALREKGQFWTPPWVAVPMVSYALGGGSDHLFDPAVGTGALFCAAREVVARTGRALELLGTEIDPAVLGRASSCLSSSDLSGVQVRDFILDPPTRQYQAIVANPPYIRHHRLPVHLKRHLRQLSVRAVGRALDGRAGYHVFFLIQSLRLLAPGGRLAFIMPADVCEGVFAKTLWQWISRNFCLTAVVAFTPEATPFPGVDTNALVLLIENAPPRDTFFWTLCTSPASSDLTGWVLSEFKPPHGGTLEVWERNLAEGLRTGLSRAPLPVGAAQGPLLVDFATVLRGIATGANSFFFLTHQQAHEFGVPSQFLLPAIGRTRDVVGNELCVDDLRTLDLAGRPTRLLALDGRPRSELPQTVQRYIQRGEDLRLDERPLIATRRPWYRMEVRSVPPILFAYLGRRNARFIRNRAGVVPLSGFLCVYPRDRDADAVERLWRVLSHPETVANLPQVGKSYGSGALKVEPRALERLPLPEHLVRDAGLDGARFSATRQLALFN